MSVFISVVSHYHSKIINELGCLKQLCNKYHVVVKSNTPGEGYDELINSTNFHWINESFGLGFGHNNNLVFNYCKNELKMSKDDYFVILNPDVIVSVADINKLIEEMKESNIFLATINLFKDVDYKVYDNSVRKFPTLKQFIFSYLGFGNSSVLDKNQISAPCYVDWAAGSFLVFKSELYSVLKGFDQRYFMYCEDIDICYRSSLQGHRVTYFPKIKATHFAKHANRRLFSKHFYWHIVGALRFLSRCYGSKKMTSIVD